MKSHLNFGNYLAVMVCLAALGTVWNNSVYADCELTKLIASDANTNDYFGDSVKISGNTAVIGAPENDDSDSNSGSAYMFRFNGSSWIQEAKLLASDGAASDNFGISVDICDNTAVIGANGDDDNGDNSGSAYIFRFNGSSWVEEAKLLASDGTAKDNFGHSVGIWGDIAIIGASWDDDNGNQSGSAYIFRFNGSSWVQEAKLLASDGDAHDEFGESVDISGDTAVIGAGVDSSAYIFQFNGSSWVEEDILLASDHSSYDDFGSSVSISGDISVIGARLNDDKGYNSGSAYIFRFNGSSWMQEAKLLASDGAALDNFGISVDICDNTAVIGASWDDDNGDNSGSAYIFRFNGSSWVEEAKLVASDGATGDSFGLSVGISGDTAVIGATEDDNNGSVYIFGLNLEPGDIDLDDDVDFYDYNLLALYWLEDECGPCNCDRADITRDGGVDYYDLKELRDNWLAGK